MLTDAVITSMFFLPTSEPLTEVIARSVSRKPSVSKLYSKEEPLFCMIFRKSATSLRSVLAFAASFCNIEASSFTFRSSSERCCSCCCSDTQRFSSDLTRSSSTLRAVFLSCISRVHFSCRLPWSNPWEGVISCSLPSRARDGDLHEILSSCRPMADWCTDCNVLSRPTRLSAETLMLFVDSLGRTSFFAFVGATFPAISDSSATTFEINAVSRCRLARISRFATCRRCSASAATVARRCDCDRR